MKIAKLLLILKLLGLAVLVGVGCGTTPYRWAESDLDSRAPGQAFAGAGMFTRKPMPDRRDVRLYEFYFKHCALGAVDRPWVSKTAYECNGPF